MRGQTTFEGRRIWAARGLMPAGCFVILGLLTGALVAEAGQRDVIVGSGTGYLGQSASPLTPAGTAFTYQGQLKQGGNLTNGQFDFTFKMYDSLSGGTQAGATITVTNQTVTNGLFTVSLDFGNDLGQFWGQARWLEMAVRPAGGGSFTTLTPRQPLTATPFAISLVPGAVITASTPSQPVISVINTGTGLSGRGDSRGVYGYSDDGRGVYGQSSGGEGVYGTSASGDGVWGQSSLGTGVRGVGLGNNGRGVYGEANNGTSAIGVSGSSSSGDGVRGTSTANGGVGVYGTSTHATAGTGVYGSSLAGRGVWGVSLDTNGQGVYGQAGVGSTAAGVYGTSSSGYGVYGTSSSSGGAGVYGTSTSSNGEGIYGQADNGSTASGVYGTSSSGRGVYGVSTATNGRGVYGDATGVSGVGVYGHSGGFRGVYGESNSGYGVYGESFQSAGVYGTSQSTGVEGYSESGSGVEGFSAATYGEGVYGSGYGNLYASGVYGFQTAGYGVYGSGRIGIYGDANQAVNSLAGYFAGDVEITGDCCGMAAGSVKLDHPQDPAGKYLNHALVASNEMKTIYDGVVVLDAKGEAVVALPQYFEALNKDFQYGFAPIGAPMPGLYVADEVKENRFKIAGGKAGAKVSWQVTGVRKDAYAAAHPLTAEETKPTEEQGKYRNPEELGKSESEGVGYEERKRRQERGEQKALERGAKP